MRIEIGGAVITDEVAEVVATLQNEPDIRKMYIEALDEVAWTLVSNTMVTADDDDSDQVDARTMSMLRALQLMRRDILTIATPPDVDTHAASL